MADPKTHLRELSVALGIKENKDLDISSITPNIFLNMVKKIINNNISQANNILSLNNSDFLSIMNNGIKLGRKFVDKGLVNPNNQIIWSGGDTHKDNPIDIFVGEVGLSLKEDSYILENMGLYKYLNLITSSKCQRGLHVFEYFAGKEYNLWFQYTWCKLLESLSKSNWSEDNGRYKSEIRMSNSFVVFLIDGKVLSQTPSKLINIQEFIKYTNGLAREKVFAKWINSQLSNNQRYLKLKKTCSQTAGINICSFVNSNLNTVNIARFLQIYDRDYYYGKSTQNELAIFHVPSKNTYLNEISIQEVKYSVPASQLNILTKIDNLKTGNSLTFRNECRFSHGQFNGTPEAKMYYERGNDLSVIYERIV